MDTQSTAQLDTPEELTGLEKQKHRLAVLWVMQVEAYALATDRLMNPDLGNNDLWRFGRALARRKRYMRKYSGLFEHELERIGDLANLGEHLNEIQLMAWENMRENLSYIPEWEKYAQESLKEFPISVAQR